MSQEDHGNSSRRTVIKTIGASGIVGLAGCTGSDSSSGETAGESDGSDFPSEDITVLMSKGAGGATDVYTRQLIGPAIESLGVNPQFEYVTGAGGMRALATLLNQGGDGHAIASFNIAGGIFSYLLNEPDFDLLDFKPVSTTSVGAFTMFTHPDYEDVNNMGDVLEKYSSGEWSTIAGQGKGDATNALILKMTQNEEYGLTYDNYTQFGGTSPTAAALSRKEMPVMVGSDGGAREFYRNGDIDAIATMTSNGSPIFPEIPTVTEQGYTTWDYLATVRRGFVLHPDASKTQQETLDNAVGTVRESEEVTSWEEESGMPITYMDHEEYGSMIENGVDKVPKVIDLDQFR